MMMGMMGWGVQEQGWRKGPWAPEEDELLSQYVKLHGEGRWSSVSRSSGLNRSGKSCRLRWVNYLRPGLKRGHITPQEEGIIIELHAIWGNKWSTIARYLPGRTDNEIKNYWRTHFKKRDRSFKKRKPQLSRQQNWHQMPGMHGPSNEEKGSIYQENCTQHHQQQQQVQQENPTFEAQTTGYDCIMQPTLDINHGDCMLSKEIISPSSWSDFRIDGDLWDGLWNFDDPSSFDHHASNNYNKVAAMCIHQLPSPTTAVYEGNPCNFNNGVNNIFWEKPVQD